MGAYRLGFRRGVLFSGQTVGGFNSVAAGGHGGIGRLVSLFEQGVQGGFAGLARRDTDADRHRQSVSVLRNFERLGLDHRAQAVSRAKRRLGVHIRYQNDEFFAAKTDRRIEAAHPAHHALPDTAQDVVSGGVSLVIIDLLEMVGIHDQQRIHSPER